VLRALLAGLALAGPALVVEIMLAVAR
jgi:hypothetical protein